MKLPSLTGTPYRFGKEKYYLDSTFTTKAEANARATKLRGQGYKARTRKLVIAGVRAIEVYRR